MNLGNKISSSDVEKARNKRHPPEYVPGFSPSDNDEFGEYELFDTLDDDFGGQSGNGAFDDVFGGESSQGNLGGPLWGSQNSGTVAPAWGTHGNGLGAQNNNYNNMLGNNAGIFGNQAPQNNVQTPAKPSYYDVALEAAGNGTVALGKLLYKLLKTCRHRTHDDIGYLGRNLIITGGIVAAAGTAIGILGSIAGNTYFGFGGIALNILGSGSITAGSGLIMLGAAALVIVAKNPKDDMTISDISDIADVNGEDCTDRYESISEDIFGDFEDELDSWGGLGLEDDSENIGSGDWGTTAFEEEETEQDKIEYIEESEEVDFKKRVEEVPENRLLSREVLFNTFKTFYPKNCINFSKTIEMKPESKEFQQIEAICLKALANVSRSKIEDVDSKAESIVDSYFSYEIRLQRVLGLNKLDDIAKEITSYFRDSSADLGVNATVDLEGDFYKIIVTKGVNSIITLGDVFNDPEICEFFLNTKNKLPIVEGITDLGKPIVHDARHYESMLIAGKPRSGKSWYMLSILMALMANNTPEDVQFIIVDPKKVHLFNTIALMPHVCGLHDETNILDIMKEIIEVEGARRKKLLADNICDDIWALRSKGIMLPIMYLVVDEVVSVKGSLGSSSGEFDRMLLTIITQLPSIGIRTIVIPHRATNTITKDNRNLLSFTAAIRSTPNDIVNTLDIKKWDRALISEGEMAIKTALMPTAKYLRSCALTASDEMNSELILSMAKAFYKLGVDIPDMSHLKIACNRDEDEVREILRNDGRRVQFDTQKLKEELMNM